jgi:hypothetical protein
MAISFQVLTSARVQQEYRAKLILFSRQILVSFITKITTQLRKARDEQQEKTLENERLTISTWFFSPGQLRFNICSKERFIRKPTAPQVI